MSNIDYAVFPIAGMGTRFLPITKSIPKEMLNISSKPLIQYAVEEAKNAGIKNMIFITSPHNKITKNYFSRDPKLENLLKEKKNIAALKAMKEIVKNEKNITYITQNKPKGLGAAILMTEKFLGGRDFAVILPDDFILGKNCTNELINIYKRKSSNVLAIQEVKRKNLSKYGIIDYDGKNIKSNIYKVKDLVEKPFPSKAPSNFGIIGRYILKNSIFKYLKKIKPGTGGELQLTDAIALSIHSSDIYAYKCSGTRYDCGSKKDFMKAQIAYENYFK